MKLRILTSMTVITAFVALTVASRLAAQEKSNKKTVHYTVVNLGTLGGTQGGANSINNRGWVAGVANKADDQTARATLWRDGEAKDLGTLGGTNSAVSWPVKNTRGEIVGIAETADVDPFGETFSCAPFFGTPHTGHICRGFVWQDDVMTGLPTLGGNNSYAAGANNRGQIVGWAENTVHDSTCVLPQVLQFRAVVWKPKDSQIQELPPFSDDTSSAATAINERGQVVGISGTCDRAFGRFSAAHAVIWQDGTVTDLGSLGGVAWNTPTAINQHGDIAGFSDFPGDEGGGLNAHAVLWPRGGDIQDLGALPGDAISLAFGINDHGQIVGQSIGAGGSRAVIWQDGVRTDLNMLTEPGSPLLIYVNDINDRGEIAGQGCDPCVGETFAVKLIPRHGGD
jgi:probable HAF family extracellular repeat protein